MRKLILREHLETLFRIHSMHKSNKDMNICVYIGGNFLIHALIMKPARPIIDMFIEATYFRIQKYCSLFIECQQVFNALILLFGYVCPWTLFRGKYLYVILGWSISRILALGEKFSRKELVAWKRDIYACKKLKLGVFGLFT